MATQVWLPGSSSWVAVGTPRIDLMRDQRAALDETLTALDDPDGDPGGGTREID